MFTIFYLFLIFIVASITDFFDGYLARKWKTETSFGKFLDPLADKIIVLSCLVAFCFLQKQVEIWMIMIILGRDLMITALRYFAIYKNTVMQTNFFGKVKTVIQISAIIALFIFLILTPDFMRIDINMVYENAKNFKMQTAILQSSFIFYFFS